MGITNLWAFVTDPDHDLREDIKLYDTKVIVDGVSLYKSIYKQLLSKVNHRLQLFGGDYDVYEKECKKFFDNFKKCNVELLVVLDGGLAKNATRKMARILERFDSKLDCAIETSCGFEMALSWVKKNHVQWLMIATVIIEVMKQLKIEFVQCANREADEMILELAKKHNYPILTDDSDFIFENLPGGVIQMSGLFFHPLEVSTQKDFKYIYTKIYKFDISKFHKLFRNLKAELLPLYGHLKGNDYTDNQIASQILSELELDLKDPLFPPRPSKGYFYKQTRIVFQWLSEQKSYESACEKLEKVVKPKVKNSLNSDRVDDFVRQITKASQSTQQATQVDRQDVEIPVEMKHRFENGQIHPRLANIMCHNFDIYSVCLENYQPGVNSSPHKCTLELYEYCYGLLRKDDSVEQQPIKIIIAECNKRVPNKSVIPRIKLGSSQIPMLKKILSAKTTKERKKIYDLFLKIIEQVCFGTHQQGELLKSLFDKIGSTVQDEKSKCPLFAMLLALIMMHCKASNHIHTPDKWNAFLRAMFTQILLVGHVGDNFDGQKDLSNCSLVSIDSQRKCLKELADPEKLPFDIEITDWYNRWQNCLLAIVFLAQLLNLPQYVDQVGRFITGLKGTFIHSLTDELKQNKSPNYFGEILGKLTNVKELFDETLNLSLKCCDASKDEQISTATVVTEGPIQSGRGPSNKGPSKVQTIPEGQNNVQQKAKKNKKKKKNKTSKQ